MLDRILGIAMSGYFSVSIYTHAHSPIVSMNWSPALKMGLCKLKMAVSVNQEKLSDRALIRMYVLKQNGCHSKAESL